MQFPGRVTGELTDLLSSGRLSIDWSAAVGVGGWS